jgi:probable phosphoglycerate mutase
MYLYLIRHGESYVNLPDWRPAARTELDAGLTERGQRQAEAMAAWMANHVPVIDALYASTMRRAQETAGHLADTYGMDISHDDRIRESGNNFADGTPLPAHGLPQKWGDFVIREQPYLPMAADVEGSESAMHFRLRVGLFIEAMVERHWGDTVIAVCHGGVINAAFDHIFGVGPYRRCQLWNPNTAVSLFQYLGEIRSEPWRLYYMGRADHLKGLA